MKKRLLVCGVVCGLICAVCVFLYTEMVYAEADSKRTEALQRYGGEQVEVLVATKTIHPGETLDPSNCTTTTWLSDLLPEGALMNIDETAGKQATSLILQGEVVSSSRFDNETKELDIPAGSVAIALPAQDVQAVGGSITVGSKVDVYATGTKTTCLGRDLEVLATSAGTEESSTRSKITWVTLAVDPEKTQEFVAASQSMDIYFTLPSAKPKELTDNMTEQTPSEQTNAPSSVSNTTNNSDT